MIRSVGADGRIETGGVFTPIQRDRIIERVAHAAQQRIALIVAPAGYGKSVALSQYLATLKQPFIRYDVRTEHSTLLGFVRGFVAALSSVSPNLRNTLADAFDRSLTAKSAGSELASWLHAHIEGYEGFIAIDDLQVAEGEPEVPKFIATLVERTKYKIRWIIATRSTLDLPVASWLAYSDMGLAVDESDLRFTPDEARDAARTARVAVRDNELSQILRLTRGWPTAFTFALRSTLRSSDLQHLETETREKIYHYLAEQVFRSLDEAQQKLLLFASFLGDIDVPVLRAAGFHNSEAIIEAIRQRVAFIYKEGEGRYRCHDLFRDFLQFELRQRGEHEYREAQLRAAQALLESGRDALALAAFSQARAIDETLSIIERRGLELIEQGHGDVVSRATSLLPKDVQQRNPSVLAIRASAETAAGRFDSAEHLYKRAIALSNDETFKASAAIRLLVLLTNRGSVDPARIDSLVRLDTLPANLKAEALPALAGAHAVAGRKDVAKSFIDESQEFARYYDSDEMRMRAMQRVGFAAFYIGDYTAAQRFSQECVRLAERLGYYILAARAYSVLSASAMAVSDDISRTLWYAEQNAASAGKAGDRLGRHTALVQMYEIEARRGNVNRLEAIENDIVALQIDDPVRSTMLLPARAMRFAWVGDFGTAHRLACRLCEKQSFAVMRLLRRAECAAYLMGDGRRDEALRYADQALMEAKRIEATSQYDVDHRGIGVGFVALVYGVFGRISGAMQLLRQQRASSESQVGCVLAQTCSVLLKATKSPAYDKELNEHLDELRSLDFGGYALLLGALFRRLRQSRQQAVLGLTKAEVEVLEALSVGSTAKHIALERGRSVHTIHAQIRSVIDKLGCSGRGEALAMARREGLLH